MRDNESADYASLIAVLMAMPTLVATLGVGVIEGRGVVLGRQTRAIDTAPHALIAALESGEAERVFAIIRAGRDPDELVWYRHPDLTGGQAVRTAPLLIAVARRDENMVLMLLNAGAARDARSGRLAACVAESLGEPGLADAIRRFANRALAECLRPEPGAPPLTSVAGVEGSGE